MDGNTLYELLNFDIDDLLSPWVPQNRLHILPKWLSRFLGYRSTPQKEPPTVVQWLLTLVATLAGICVVGATYTHAPGLLKYHPPVMVASFGASAVLDFSTIKSPLAQPRNTILGHALSAIIGVGVSKLFQLNPYLFANYSWVAAAFACAGASVAMSITNCVHPPGGATAILACIEAQIVGMGWTFVPIVLIGSVLMLGVACLFNNTLRQYPMYWWTPGAVGRKLRKLKEEEASRAKEEEEGDDIEKQRSRADSERTLRRELSNHVEFLERGAEEIHIFPYKVLVPEHLEITPDEAAMLQNLQERIRAHGETGIA